MVGGGVVGCFIAYRLASIGVPVTLVEQAGPGSGATGNSAGNIQPASGDDDAYKIALGAESLALWRKHLPQIKEAGGIDYREQDVRYLYASINEDEESEVRRILDDVQAAIAAGSAAVERVGELNSARVVSRPAPEVMACFGGSAAVFWMLEK